MGCAELATCQEKVGQNEVGSPLPLCILPPQLDLPSALVLQKVEDM